MSKIYALLDILILIIAVLVAYFAGKCFICLMIRMGLDVGIVAWFEFIISNTLVGAGLLLTLTSLIEKIKDKING